METVSAEQGTTILNSADRQWTVQEVTEFALRLKPVEAAHKQDSSLCMTPLITCIITDGEAVALELNKGKYAVGYVRVSRPLQRSALSMENAPEKRRTFRGRRGRVALESDGYSEAEQLTRQIHYFIQQRMAFKIISDAGITGEYPTNDPALIETLLTNKAKRYRKIYEKTLLDDVTIKKWTPEQLALMRAYLDKAEQIILRGSLTGDEIETAGDLCPRSKLRLRGVRRKNYFRQGLTQLWNDIKDDLVHTVAVSDRSRLCRSADMESQLLVLLSDHGTRLHGLHEDLSSLDVSTPITKGYAYLMASINEYRLSEQASHSFRGYLQLMESGRPNGNIPWWLQRDEEGRAALIPGRDGLIHRIVGLYLSGLGFGTITKKLHAEGVKVDGKCLTRTQIGYMLSKDALAGHQTYFGIPWPVYPRIISDETLAEIREQQKVRCEGLDNLHDPSKWAAHLFTGVCRCPCGEWLIFNGSTHVNRRGIEATYYRCLTLCKEPDEPRHGCLTEQALEAFIDELLGQNPHIVEHALNAGSDQATKSAARRAVIEEDCRAAEAVYKGLEGEARRKAEATAAGVLRPDSPGYQVVVETICQGLLEGQDTDLLNFRRSLSQLDAEGSHKKAGMKALEAVGSLHQWSNLDTLTRNRLLRALFVITMHPPDVRGKKGKGEHLDIRLAGTDIHLPPVNVKRGKWSAMRLPTVAEWVAEMFCEDTAQ